MKYARLLIGIVIFWVPFSGFGQDEIQRGGFVVQPEVSVRGTYDDRVVLSDPPDGTAEGDLYSDVAAGIRLQNLPARISVSALAYYGNRFYSKYTELEDDFYRVWVAVGSEEDSFQWGVSADVDKMLNYSTSYDPASGNIPGSIITDVPNRRTLVQGNVAYDWFMTDSTSIKPQYRLLHYLQAFEGSGTAEWQIQQAALQLRHRHSERILFTIAGYYSLQTNKEEDGYIGGVLFGVEGNVSDKTSWLAEIGVSHADYEFSGTDQGVVSHLRGNWKATDKVSAYVFGGNDFQPGYDGGPARWVYRLGYGLAWQMVEKLGFYASVLHDYQQAIGEATTVDPALGAVRHFIDVGVSQQFTDRCYALAGFRRNIDEIDPDQNLVFLRVGYRL